MDGAPASYIRVQLSMVFHFWGSFFTIGELIFKATQNGLDFKKIFEYLSGEHYVSINSRMFG